MNFPSAVSVNKTPTNSESKRHANLEMFLFAFALLLCFVFVFVFLFIFIVVCVCVFAAMSACVFAAISERFYACSAIKKCSPLPPHLWAFNGTCLCHLRRHSPRIPVSGTSDDARWHADDCGASEATDCNRQYPWHAVAIGIEYINK